MNRKDYFLRKSLEPNDKNILQITFLIDEAFFLFQNSVFKTLGQETESYNIETEIDVA